MNRHQIAAALNEIGLLLELVGENPFKARAYYQAARTVESRGEEIEELWREGRLAELPGFGVALTEKLDELLSTGSLAYLERLRERIPAGLIELLRLPGLGPKKIRTLHEKLGVVSLEDLEAACTANRLASLPGFGARTQEKILAALETIRLYRGRYLPVQVAEEVETVLTALREMPGVIRAEAAGSFRRRKETIKDLDFVVAAAKEGLAAELTALPWMREVVAAGPTKVTLRLLSGITADFRLVPENSFACAWLHFTGNAEHNAELRRIAEERGLKLNEYGLFAGETPLELSTEESIYEALGLAYIPPELREGAGEIEAAAEGKLPNLLSPADLKGVLHCHTIASDGRASLRQMASACRSMGLRYLGIADHSRSARYARGLSIENLIRQCEEIDRLNEEFSDFRLLKGVECDILPDGSLDYPDEILERLDYVVASVHSNFQMDRAAMTRRIVRAVGHPRVTILGHPTGRLLLEREGYAVDLEEVLHAAAAAGTALEFNANPYRYDLDWRWCRRATARGVRLAVNPDAHGEEDLALVYSGVEVVRKGWAEPKDVVNAWDLETFLRWSAGKRDFRRES